jgi:hypothetical protein
MRSRVLSLGLLAMVSACGGSAFGDAGGSGGMRPGLGGQQNSGGASASSVVNTGGITGFGGSVGYGGTVMSGGSDALTGGAKATGGNAALGGTIGSGGVIASGGSNATGGNLALGGATVFNGGSKASGGSVATGGKGSGGSNTGGTRSTWPIPTGGATTSATGGGTHRGGSRATSGSPSTGGAPATGGDAQTGGAPSTGGVAQTGGAWTGGSSSIDERPGAPCTAASDCKVVNDCCTCDVYSAAATAPICTESCKQPMCDGKGISSNDVACIAGRCVFSLSCDTSTVVCEMMTPQCEAGQTPSVKGACYGPCLPIGRCAAVTSCRECESAGLTCVKFETMNPSYHCVLTPEDCGNDPTCECMGVCNDGGLVCGAVTGTELTCDCPDC